MKDPHRYDVQGSDTTMMPIAASLPGQQKQEARIQMLENKLKNKL